MVEVVDCDFSDEERGNGQTYDFVVPQQEMQDYAVLGDSDTLSVNNILIFPLKFHKSTIKTIRRI
jgi:hypothetical protein